MPSLVIPSTCSAVDATRELVMAPEYMISGLFFFKGDIPGEKKALWSSEKEQRGNACHCEYILTFIFM